MVVVVVVGHLAVDVVGVVDQAVTGEVGLVDDALFGWDSGTTAAPPLATVGDGLGGLVDDRAGGGEVAPVFGLGLGIDSGSDWW